MRHDPGEHDHSHPYKAQIHSDRPLIVSAQHDVVHVARKSSHHDQGDVHGEKCKKAEHGQEMDRTGGLSAAENPRIPRKTVNHGWRHRDACGMASGPKTKRL